MARCVAKGARQSGAALASKNLNLQGERRTLRSLFPVAFQTQAQRNRQKAPFTMSDE